MAAKILSIRPGKFAVPGEMVLTGREPSGMASAEAAPPGTARAGAAPSGTARAGAAPSGSESTPLGPSSGGVAPAGAIPDSAISDGTMPGRAMSAGVASASGGAWSEEGPSAERPGTPALHLADGPACPARPSVPVPAWPPPAARGPAAQSQVRPAAPVPAPRSVAAGLPVSAESADGARPRRQHVSPSIRSAERRRWCAELLAPGMACVVLHGAGGIGKSALAAQIAARAVRLEPGRLTVTFTGEVSADTFLARLASALRRHPVAAA